jgi:hypothetical protein
MTPRSYPLPARRRRGWRRGFLTLALCARMLAPSPSRAETHPGDDGPGAAPSARLLEPEAPLHVALWPRALQADAAFWRALLMLSSEASSLHAETRDLLGFDLLDRESLARTGIDPASPLLVSAFAIDRAEVDAAFRAATGALSQRQWKTLRHLPHASYRHRVVARIADPGLLGSYLSSHAGDRLVSLSPASVQRVSGLDRKASVEVAALLRGAGTVGLARLRGDGFVVVRVAEEAMLVVDLVQPWLGASIRPQDAAALFRRLVAPQRGSRQHAPLERASLRLLAAGAAIAVHVSVARLADLAEINLRERVLATISRIPAQERARSLTEAQTQASTCREGFARAASSATLGDLTAAVRLDAGSIEGRFSWSLAPGRGEAFAVRDDHLVNLASVARDSLAVVGLRLDLPRFHGLTAREGPFAGLLADASRFASACGPLAELLLAVRFWPELLAVSLEEARHERDAGPLVAGLHNLVVALHSLSPSGEPRLFAFASLDAAAARVLERLAQAGRTPVLLSRAPLSSGRSLVIAASDQEVLAHAQQLGLKRSTLSPRSPAMELLADLGRLLSGGGPKLGVTGRALISRLGRLSGELSPDGASLGGRMRLELR